MQISHWLAGLRASRGASGRAKRRLCPPSAPACIDLLESRTLLSALPVGPNDFRISQMGQDGDPRIDAADPAIAYNGLANEYLVVWSGADTLGDHQVHGQRIDAATGELIGGEIRISSMGESNRSSGRVWSPAVAYDQDTNCYLVVWMGRDGVSADTAIYGQRLTADGREIGTNDFAITEPGPYAHQSHTAGIPTLVYNSQAREYLVVWSAGRSMQEQVYGQRLTSEGTKVGKNRLQISSDASGRADYAGAPRIAYNSVDNQYLVIWQESVWQSNQWGMEYTTTWVYGQRLSADGTEIGDDDFQITAAEPFRYDADVAYNPAENEYLVVWSQAAVFGLRLSAHGTEIGTGILQISDPVPQGMSSNIFDVAITYSSRASEYLVVFERALHGNGFSEHEIIGHSVSGIGNEVGSDFHISDVDSHVDEVYFRAQQPVVSYNSKDDEYLVTWIADDGEAGLADDEFEIFGQRLAASGGPRKYIATGADAGGGPHVKVFDAVTGDLVFSFFAYDPAFGGGVRVAVADVTGDGVDDIITAAGHGGGPHVKIFDGYTGELVRELMAYDIAFTGGVHVAAGDFDGDGRADVVTGADAGGGPHVRIISGATGELIAERYAYVAEFAGGVRLAVGDVNGDGHDDLITAAGPGGGPHVKVFDGTDLLGDPLLQFFAGSADFSGGIYVAAGDLNNDGFADVVTGQGPGGESLVIAWNLREGTATFGKRVRPYSADFAGGVRVAIADTNGDGQLDVIASPRPGVAPQIVVYDGWAFLSAFTVQSQLIREFPAYVPEFTGGVFVAGSPDPAPAEEGITAHARFSDSSDTPHAELTNDSLDALFGEDDPLDPLSVPAAAV